MKDEQEIKDMLAVKQEFMNMLTEIPWYRRYLPLPIWYSNKELRTFTFQLFDCSVTHKSLTKLHRFDILIKNHRKWWQPKYVGFTVWCK